MSDRDGWRLWRPVFVVVGLMLLVFARVLSWYLRDEHSTDNLTPHGERLFFIFVVTLPCLPALGILWSAITRRVVTRLIVTLVLLILVGAAAPVMFFGVLPPLFGGHYTKSFTSPDGKREAHVFVGGLLGCNATLYVSEPRGVWGTYVESRSIKCDSEDVLWADDGRPVLDGGAEEPLPFLFGPR
ncbi:MAG: hypothetical protein JNM17_25665 [Archangium sp.]|nr:hypothetical protein [Archangium sp.]